MWGTVDAQAATVTITDFDPAAGDRIHLRTGAMSFDDNYEPVQGPIPTFAGRTNDIGQDEVGYTTLRRGDGTTDTIITHRYLYVPVRDSWGCQTRTRVPDRARGLSGGLSESDFVFL